MKLAPIADNRMWDLFNKQNLVHRFMGPIMTGSKILWHVNSMFFALSDSSCSFHLIHNLRTTTGSNFVIAVIRACATALASRLSTVADVSPSISMD